LKLPLRFRGRDPSTVARDDGQFGKRKLSTAS
jgi:hypothetical protein